MANYRVTWIDTKTGTARSVDVATMRTAQDMTRTLLKARDVQEVELVVTPSASSFRQMSITFQR